MSSSNISGAWAELQASAAFLGLGFQVFRNVAPRGPHDLAVHDPEMGGVLLVDVTLGRYRFRNDGSEVLSSNASSKLRVKDADHVVIYTSKQEMFFAELDIEAGILYEGPRGYPIRFTRVTRETVNQRMRPANPRTY